MAFQIHYKKQPNMSSLMYLLRQWVKITTSKITRKLHVITVLSCVRTEFDFFKQLNHLKRNGKLTFV